MSHYSRGRVKEYLAIASLKKMGFEVFRSAGSHGRWDIIAWKSKESSFGWWRFIQVKYGTDATKKEKAELQAAAVPLGVSKELWFYRKGKSKPEINRF